MGASDFVFFQKQKFTKKELIKIFKINRVRYVEMCTNQHSIELKNFRECSVFNREFLLLSGFVKSPCECESIEITRNNDGQSWKVPIFGRNFKQLIRLVRDCDNKLELRFCNVKLHVNARHKSIGIFRYDVQPLYIIVKNSHGKFQTTSDDDRNEIDDAVRRINLALELSQCVFSSKFHENDLDERAFVLQPCRVFRSDLPEEEVKLLNQWELYDAIAGELFEKEGSEWVNRRKFVAFLSCTRFEGLKDDVEYSYENIKARTFANPALGGGFLCLLGSGCFYTWPDYISEVSEAFRNNTPVDLKQVLDDSNYRRTYGGCFATSLGTLIHELGHCFDLAHTENGLMGNDFDYINRFFLSENLTEILPKRIVRSCQLTKEQEVKFQPRRFTAIKKPGGQFLDKYRQQRDNDLTFFEANCLVTLWFHRWFTQSNAEVKLVYNESERKVKCDAGELKLVEIRESTNSVTVKFWSLSEQSVREFVIPPEVQLKNGSLFAITSCGDILKKTL